MHGFKMSFRIEKFDIGLSYLSAHTLRIIEIIEEEKNNIQGNQIQKIKGQING